MTDSETNTIGDNKGDVANNKVVNNTSSDGDGGEECTASKTLDTIVTRWMGNPEVGINLTKFSGAAREKPKEFMKQFKPFMGRVEEE